MTTLKAEIDRVYKSCTRFLAHDYPRTPRQTLSELAEMVDPDLDADRYGEGELINRFERDVARLLGKEAAVFMPSGTMCQQIALRIWANRRGTSNVAFHPTSHLELHERHAYQRLHGLSGILLGSPNVLMTLEDLKNVSEPLGALLIELPQREIGGQLPSWEDLCAITTWAREQEIPIHMDGARLWECRPFYGREYAEISALFDSVYVSFYKVLNGIAGAILAGPVDVIAEARVWQRRHGGNLIHLYPYVLSARKGLTEQLERMDAFCAKAKEVASVLSSLPQIEIVPNPPQTNMMHVYVRGDREKLQAAALDVSRKTHVWLTGYFASTILPGYSKFELSVGNATLDLTNDEIGELFQDLLAHS